MKSIWMALFAMAIVMTATAQKKKELTTTVNLNYCLPKVAYRVAVELECSRSVPGPYRNYAEKELGLRPEITSPSEQWAIIKLEVTPEYLPDEKAVYSVSAAGDYLPVLLSLSAEGFLAGVSAGQGGVFNEEGKMRFQADESRKEEEINIIKLNTYNHLKEVLDTNYTFQEIDGVMKKIWDPIVRYVPKNEKDNVKEAVSEIFRIRSERVKLLSAENNVPDGKSLEIILKEFDRMEENYLSLFLGKEEKQTIRREFICIPEKADEPMVAFRFSEKAGITDLKNVEALPYLLKVENVVVPASTPVGGEAAAAAIFYRVPAVGDLKLIKGKEEIRSFRTIVPQLGEVKKFPVDVISNEGLSLEFYPKYGALKSVSKK